MEASSGITKISMFQPSRSWKALALHTVGGRGAAQTLGLRRARRRIRLDGRSNHGAIERRSIQKREMENGNSLEFVVAERALPAPEHSRQSEVAFRARRYKVWLSPHNHNRGPLPASAADYPSHGGRIAVMTCKAGGQQRRPALVPTWSPLRNEEHPWGCRCCRLSV